MIWCGPSPLLFFKRNLEDISFQLGIPLIPLQAATTVEAVVQVVICAVNQYHLHVHGSASGLLAAVGGRVVACMITVLSRPKYPIMGYLGIK